MAATRKKNTLVRHLFNTPTIFLFSILILFQQYSTSYCESPCSINQFQCFSNKKCIALTQRCDSLKDCEDGSDEHNCPQETCLGKFKCGNKRCIPKEWVCDGEADCDDRTDEENCNKCPPHMFACSNGTCIEKRRIKDYKNDCEDGQDESESVWYNYVLSCGDDMFECTNKHCISNTLICDGKNNCGDNSDENASLCQASCTEDEFQCSNGRCISMDLVCDTTTDCPNGEDEESCNNCPAGKFQCLNDEKAKFCLDLSLRCNGFDDCGDGSDEEDCPKASNVPGKNYHHDHELLHSCAAGFHFEPERESCEDNDECAEDYAYCSGQDCLNKPGSFECKCSPGYEISGQKLCRASSKVKPNVYFVKQNGRVGKFELDVEFHQESKMNFMISPRKDVLLFDWNNQWNYFFAASSDGVMIVDRINKSLPGFFIENVTPEIFVNCGQQIQAIALDWQNHVVFYINKRKIQATKLPRFQQPMTLIETHIHDPLDLRVNPQESWFVWSDGGDKNSSVPAKIEKISYDGYQRRIIYRNPNELVRPNCLTIDFATRRIFWLDSVLGTIGSLDYDGKNRHIVVQSLQHAIGIDVFDHLIFWFNQHTIHAFDKFGNVDNFDDLHQVRVPENMIGNETLRSLHIIHELRQPLDPQGSISEKCLFDCPYLCQDGQCICPRFYVRFNKTCYTTKEYHRIVANMSYTPSRDIEEYFYIVASLITILIAVVFVTPYIWKAIIRRIRRLKDKQQYHCMMAQLPRKSIINTLIVAGTTVVTRTDDVSSGYASISEQTSITNRATFDEDDDDENNSCSPSNDLNERRESWYSAV